MPAKLFQFLKSPSLDAYISFTVTLSFDRPYLHPHRRLPASVIKSTLGIFLSIVTVASMVYPLSIIPVTTMELASGVAQTTTESVMPSIVSRSLAEMVMPSPTENCSPIFDPAEDIFIYEVATDTH